MVNAISRVVCCGSNRADYYPVNEKQHFSDSILDERAGYQKTKPLNIDDTDTLAQKAISALIKGDEQPIKSINEQLSRDAVRATSWTESLAQSILDRLVEAIQPGTPIGDALRDTYDRVREAALEAFEFIEDHPEILVIIIALGILCLIAPWVINVLGWTRAGVTAGSWAARWQSTFGGFIEEGSLFAWLQRFGALH